MISLSASGGSVVFTFTNSTYYLYGDGTITVPVNSLSLVIDNSNIATFKKAATNDIFVAAPLAEFGMSKAEIEAFYKENMVGSTGGGGGGGVTSGEVETMIDVALTDYYDIDEVDAAISAATDDMATQTWVGNQGYITEDAISGKADTSAVTESINAAVSGKLDTSTFETYSGDVETALSAKLDASAYTPTDLSEYWTSAQTESAITNAVSGKQDTLSAGTGISISGNVISATGGGGGANAIEVTQAEYEALVSAGTVDLTAFYIITDAPAVDLSGYAQTSAVTAEITAAVSGKADTSALTAVSNALTAHTGNSTIHVTSSEKSSWNGKQDALVSGTNIKTINNESLLGSGNIVIQGGGAASSAITSGDTNAVAGGAVYDKFDEVEQVTAAALNALNDNFGGLKLVKLTQQEYDDLAVKNNNTLYVII